MFNVRQILLPEAPIFQKSATAIFTKIARPAQKDALT